MKYIDTLRIEKRINNILTKEQFEHLLIYLKYRRSHGKIGDTFYYHINDDGVVEEMDFETEFYKRHNFVVIEIVSNKMRSYQEFEERLSNFINHK